MAEKKTAWWNPFDGDLVPFINVREAGKQYLDPRGDYDVLNNVSMDGGTRNAENGIVGKTGAPQTTPGGAGGGGGWGAASPNTATVDELSKNVTYDNGAAGGGAQIDPMAALRAEQASKAQGIRSGILARSGEVDKLYQDIVGAIESLVADKSKKRKGQYDTETASLIDALNAAIPEIQKAFASLGLSSSTFVGDRVDSTNQEFAKSQDAVDTGYQTDLENYGGWATTEKGNAKTSADKINNTLKYVEGADATADNLSRLQEAELTFGNTLSDFGNQANRYTSSGEALKALEGVGSDYDFSKIMDSFGSLAASSANTGTGGGAAKAVLDNIRGLDPKNKKKLTEAQVNNPVGAAAA